MLKFGLKLIASCKTEFKTKVRPDFYSLGQLKNNNNNNNGFV